MAYIDDVLPEVDEPTNFEAVMATHRANQVPTSAWVSLVNVGLSLTHYVSEAVTVGRNLVRQVLRGLYADTVVADAQAAPDPSTLARVTAAAVAFAKSQYQEDQQPSTFAVLRVQLTSVSGAPKYDFAAGDATVGTPDGTLLYVLDEALQLHPGGKVIGLFKATSPGSTYNLPPGSTIELKTTFVGVSASLPLSGQRVTFGNGSLVNTRLTISLAEIPGYDAIQFRINSLSLPSNPSIYTVETPAGSQLNIDVVTRTDGGGVTISTAEELRVFLTTYNRIAGAQLPPGTDGSGVFSDNGEFPFPMATTDLEVPGQDTQLAVDLMAVSVAKWDALLVGTGTDDALYYWTFKPPAGYAHTPVVQAKVLNITKPDGTISGGFVTIIVSGQIGPLSTDDLNAVRSNFVNPRKNAAFTTLSVVNTVAHNITVTADVTYYLTSNLQPADLASAIAASLQRLQELLQFGSQTIDPSLVEGYVVTASTAIKSIVMSAPAAPVTLAWNERAVFVMSGFTYTGV